MLLLTRKKTESVIVGGSGDLNVRIKVTVLNVSGKQVKLGFEADGVVSIQRWELWQRIHLADAAGSPSAQQMDGTLSPEVALGPS